jgi:hypothetical protein
MYRNGESILLYEFGDAMKAKKDGKTRTESHVWKSREENR